MCLDDPGTSSGGGGLGLILTYSAPYTIHFASRVSRSVSVWCVTSVANREIRI